MSTLPLMVLAVWWLGFVGTILWFINEDHRTGLIEESDLSLAWDVVLSFIWPLWLPFLLLYKSFIMLTRPRTA